MSDYVGRLLTAKVLHPGSFLRRLPAQSLAGYAVMCFALSRLLKDPQKEAGPGV